MNTVKLVAHRGESIIAPENTLEAFALAWARGAKAIEGDFHLTRDGQIVCMHDKNTRRTTGVDAEIAELTLSEIKRFDAGLWKGEAWRYTGVPTLAEVLAAMPDDGEIYIELKSVGPIVDALKAVFAQAARRPEQLTFIAFEEETIRAVKRLFPAHRAYWLTSLGSCHLTPAELAAKLTELGVDGVDIHFDGQITEAYVDAVHAAGKSFHVWTVDATHEAYRAAAMGVDSITTNRAAAIAREIR
jgi:glycerophosphoryl diester phosphodiesterase